MRKKLSKLQQKTLEGGYLLPGEDYYSALKRVCKAYGTDAAHTKRLYKAALKGWWLPATPVFSNAGNTKGLPISCYLSSVEDSIDGLVDSWVENVYLTVGGGGIGNYFGNVRSIGTKTSRGGESLGIIGFLKTVEAQMQGYNQGGCYAEGTEILTANGWVDFKDLRKDHLVAQLKEDREINFTYPEEIIEYPYTGTMIQINGPSTELLVTPDHRMMVERRKGSHRNGDTRYWPNKLEEVSATNVRYHRDVRHHCGGFMNYDTNKSLSLEDKLEIAFQADGTLHYQGSDGSYFYSFRLKKQRKIDRLLAILDGLKITYKLIVDKDEVTNIYFKKSVRLEKSFVNWFSLDRLTPKEIYEFIMEISLWDGHLKDDGTSKYTTTNKSNADFVHALCSISNHRSNYKTYERPKPRKPLYEISITGYVPCSGDTLVKSEKDYSGNVYCCTVPEGRIIVRYNNRVSVCGNSRRGAAAIYLDISHPEVEEFITMRKSGGDPMRQCLAKTVFHHAVNIPDSFMKAVLEGSTWDLIDPHSKAVIKTVKARDLWQLVLDTRMETGEPYIHFTDTSNRDYKARHKGSKLKILQSNLCNEIYLPTNKERTAVCCLSSVNLEYWDQWRDNVTFIEDLVAFLDNVLEDFLKRTEGKKAFEKARYSVQCARDIGLGAMGFHSYLQKRAIPFESALAYSLNKQMFEGLWKNASSGSAKLAAIRGEPFDMKDLGRRNSHLLAVAPNASISLIANTSPGIEPLSTNYFVQKTKQGSFIQKNKYLQVLLAEKGQDTKKVWDSIRDNEGSVQHLEFLSEDEKNIFKTAFELNQEWIITHAAERQKSIDQGQSVNIFLAPGVDKKVLNKLHINAWKMGLKGLYYLRSNTARTAENLATKVERYDLIEQPDEGCLSCGS